MRPFRYSFTKISGKPFGHQFDGAGNGYDQSGKGLVPDTITCGCFPALLHLKLFDHVDHRPPNERIVDKSTLREIQCSFQDDCLWGQPTGSCLQAGKTKNGQVMQ